MGVRVDPREAGQVADVLLDLDRGRSGDHAAGTHLAPHDAPRAHQGVLPYLYPGKDGRVRADPRAPADLRAAHAVEVRRALRGRVVREHDGRPEEPPALDRGELEEAAGVDPHAAADAIAELEGGVRPDRDVVPHDVVLPDRRAL